VERRDDRRAAAARPDGRDGFRVAAADPSPGHAGGATVALLDVGKTRGDEYLDRLQELLAARGATVRRYCKPTNTRTAPPELLRRIDAESQAVVVALSD
jgi:hypothetical protein